MGQGSGRSSAGTIASVTKALRVMEVVASDPHVADSPRRRRVQVLDVGFDEAAHATAFGKFMLAGFGRDQLHGHLGLSGMAPLTRATIVQPDQLERQLSRVRKSDVTLEMAEFRARSRDVERAVRTGATRVTRALRLVRRRPSAATTTVGQ